MLVASVAAFAQSKVYLTREITPNAQGACPPVHVLTLTALTAGAEDPTKQFPTGSGGDAGTGVAASETLYGDVNVDGSVDNLDVTLINKYLLGTAKLSEQGKKNADVDANGTIDTTDSLNILKCCLELIEQSEFPIK